MNAIVDIAGKQFQVQAGDNIHVPSISSKEGKKIIFENILLINDGKSIVVGKPNIKGAVVNATVLNHGRDKKVIVFKKKRRKGYRVKNGHRQGFTEVQIDSIKLSTTSKKKPTKSKVEKPVVKEKTKE
ncbi:50S ribosomal protein L21 [bacterium]|nr:50S ribosomal protein L21 [bacterium]MBL7052513.1 50S ribosomal protein L21 [Candidatus Neomarinimicrobiota bacterium]